MAQSDRSVFGLKALFPGLILGLFWMPQEALGGEATIFGVYEDCQPVSSTVFVRSEQLSTAQTDNIAADAEAAGNGLEFDQALPAIIASLENNGIKDIQILRQGDCNVRVESKFVETVVTYCDEKIINAELYIDGTVFFRQSGPKLVLDEFITAARRKLEAVGVFADPRFSLNNTVDCQAQ